MDLKIFVSLILAMCKFEPNEDARMQCWDRLNNCGVTAQGTILSMEEFGKKCFSK